ncbi:transposase [Thiobacter sp. AK1]|uniref:Transposase n=1 Tax=Thiobacter aerophilum TaxID=3121275 RepID=A0ABV0EGW2_9BURK
MRLFGRPLREGPPGGQNRRWRRLDRGGDRRLGQAPGAGFTSEAEINWWRFLESLLSRGLKGVKLIVADDHAGLKAARRAVLPALPWQRCHFHL